MEERGGTGSVELWVVEERTRRTERVEVIDERPLTLLVNDVRWVTLMCTPVQLRELVLGFLSAEGVIASLEEVRRLRIDPEAGLARVELTHPVELPRERILTSGCVGGLTFADLAAVHPPLGPSPPYTPEQIWRAMADLLAAARLYRRARGVHSAALSDGRRLLAVAEDVGRHNTLDKLRGRALLDGLATRGRLLVSTGRISSEMLHKAAAMGIAVVASRSSPTRLSVALARSWRIALVGYVRRGRMRVYAGPERLGLPPLPSERTALEVTLVRSG